MKYQYVFKRTDQLTEQEKKDFIELLAVAPYSVEALAEFDQEYSLTPLGYSYHGFVMAGDSIVGAYNTIPCTYKYFEKNVIFCQTVDTMIHKEHRNSPFHLSRICKLVDDAMKQDGVSFVWGVPNQAFYPYAQKVLSFRFFGELDFYILLLNLSVISRMLRFVDPIYRACVRTLIYLPNMPNFCEHDMPIEKVSDELFYRQRYNHRHKICDLKKGGKSTYRLVKSRTDSKELLILDVSPLTAANLAETMRTLYAVGVAEKADYILYQGRIPFPFLKIVWVPHFMRRSKIRMLGKILNPELIDDRVFDIKNWNINQSNMDVP